MDVEIGMAFYPFVCMACGAEFEVFRAGLKGLKRRPCPECGKPARKTVGHSVFVTGGGTQLSWKSRRDFISSIAFGAHKLRCVQEAIGKAQRQGRVFTHADVLRVASENITSRADVKRACEQLDVTLITKADVEEASTVRRSAQEVQKEERLKKNPFMKRKLAYAGYKNRQPERKMRKESEKDA